MEIILEKFPHLNKLIFSQLDNESLVTCKDVDKTWKKCIDSQKLPWIRMIEKHIGRLEQYPGTWKKVTSKTPAKNVQELALAVKKFYKYKKVDDGSNPMHITAECGTLELFQFIFEKMTEKNPSMTEKNPSKKLKVPSPLHLAADRGHYDICKFIMEHVDYKDPDYFYFSNRTPLDLAITSNHLDVCELIIKNLTNKNPSDSDGITPLHIAALFGRSEICRLIVKNVDHKNPENKNGITPLHMAAKKGHVNVYKLIMEFVDDKNPADNEGDTPLHYAAENFQKLKKIYFKVCQLILENVDVKNPSNNQGETPLSIATQYGYKKVYKLLTKRKNRKRYSKLSAVQKSKVAKICSDSQKFVAEGIRVWAE